MISKSLLVSLILLLLFTKQVYSQKTDAEIIKYSSLYEVSLGKLIQTDSIIIQINNRVGDKYTEISLPFSKTEKISDLDAWIENKDGSKVRSLKNSDITDEKAISDILFYEDNYNKCFQLKHNIYPYRIIYTYKTTSKNFIDIARWTPVIYTTIPTLNAKLKIILPKYLQFKKYENNISNGFSLDSTKNSVVLQWKTSYIKPIKTEIFSQPENYVPYVIVTPLYFQYGVDGSTKDWETYGNWQYLLMQDLDILPDTEKNTISTLIHGITDKKEIIKILYHYLQDHTRYIYVFIGIGGHKPYPASYVAQNKYGDCKALTNYMKAMLSFAGIESIYTLVYASEQPHDLIKSQTSPQFNHVILAVPLENDTIWLDNTMHSSPFGYLGTFTQNREALLVQKNQSQLVRIPTLEKENTLSSFKLTFDLNLTENTKAILNATFKGSYFEEFNQINTENNGTQKDVIIRDYMPFENYEVTNWSLKKMHRDSASIVLDATLNLNKFLKPLANEFYFSLFTSRIPAFTVPANRTLPVVLPYPIYNSDTLIYNLPTGYELKSQLDTVSLKTRFGNYTLKSNVVNKKIYVIKSFELFSGSYSLEQYPDFYSFLQSVKVTDRKKIIIKPIN